jgi:hypothetical protein
MPVKGALDLGRVDILAARDNHILDPVVDVEKPGLVEVAGRSR